MALSSEEKRSLYQRRRSNNLCVRCGVEVYDGTPYCSVHREYQRASTKNTVAKKRGGDICFHCSTEAMEITKGRQNPQCQICYLKNTAKLNLGSRKLWPLLLDKLDEQNWLCPYTGERLVLGDNASVDHILPHSRFPESRYDPNNVEWVSWKVNEMKRDKTRDEFLAMVNLIANYSRPM